MYNKIALVIIICFSIFSCNPLKKIESTKSVADEAFGKKEYSQAYTLYNNLINSYQKNNITIPAKTYLNAAESAVQMNNTSHSVELFESALKQEITIRGIKGLVNSYIKESKYEKIEEVLKQYESFLVENNESGYVKNLRFENEVSKGNQEGILSTYTNLEAPAEEQSMIYISTLEGLGRKKEAVEFCSEMIEKNPDYLKAREYKAIYYYNFAEEWYKNEMAKYNKDKNYTAYVYLKRELKKISANYRVAKVEFEALHKAKPTDKKYIKYLKNTYIRLEMKNEAADMDKLLK